MKLIVHVFILFVAQISLAAQVDIEWKKHNFNLEILTYDVNQDFAPRVSETRIYSKIEQVPKLAKPKKKFSVNPNQSQSLIIVVKNNTQRDQYFLVSPHEVFPAEGSAGLYFECLCTNKVYKVGPGEIWTRILRLNLNKNSRTSNFKISHNFIGLTEKQALTKYKSRIVEAEK